jgi:RNA polymerase sigma-70 factor (ECF subfamily)
MTFMTERNVSLSAYARRLTGNAPDADDLVQETMLRCWRARHGLRPGSNLRAWARVVMRNSFLSGRRRARFQVDLPDDALDRMMAVSESQSEAVDLRDAYWALGELVAEQRDAVMLASKGMSIDEAAHLLDIPSGTYKSRVARGRIRLRQLVENRDAATVIDKPVKAVPRRKSRDWKGVMIG